MANIAAYIEQIQNARYGEQVRSSIINALQKVNDDNEGYQGLKTDVISAKNAVDQQAISIEGKLQAAEEALTALTEITREAGVVSTDLAETVSNADPLLGNLQTVTTEADITKVDVETAVVAANEARENAEAVKGNLETAIADSITERSRLQAVIDIASTVNPDMGEIGDKIETIKENLDTAIANSIEARSRLQGVIDSAEGIMGELSGVVTQASAVKLDLDNSVTSANQVQQSLQTENDLANLNLEALRGENSTSQDIIEAVDKIAVIKDLFANNAGAHNSIYRGRDLTALYSVDEICNRIVPGTFEDLYIGDYFDVTITTQFGGSEVVRLILAGFDVFLDNPIAKHHAIIVPKDCFKTYAKMNDTNETTGGYVGSKMHTTVLPVYSEALKAIFDTHVITYRDVLTTRVSNTTVSSNAGASLTGCANESRLHDVTLRLMSEIQFYGSNIVSSSYHDTGKACTQFPLFRLAPHLKNAGKGNNGYSTGQWLSAVVSTTQFATFDSGQSGYAGASNNLGVRPYFCIG